MTSSKVSGRAQSPGKTTQRSLQDTRKRFSPFNSPSVKDKSSAVANLPWSLLLAWLDIAVVSSTVLLLIFAVAQDWMFEWVGASSSISLLDHLWATSIETALWIDSRMPVFLPVAQQIGQMPSLPGNWFALATALMIAVAGWSVRLCLKKAFEMFVLLERATDPNAR